MESIWTKTCSIEERPSLSGNIKTEVAIIGAGLCGILCAYQLAAAGKRVVILEADRIAGGQTRGTTAKITSQHGLLYSDLLKQVGQAKAAQYAHVNESAVTEYRRMISTRQIDCDFEEMDAYVYSNDCTKLKEEADIASFLGLPASFAHPSTLPFPVGGAVRFDHQAQFHPLKFIKAISEKLRIFEHTLVTKVEGNLLYTDHGFVEAEKIIFACHYPFINFPGMYFARMHQERSYVIALEGASLLDGMYIGDGNQHFSFRNYGSLLLFGGSGHRTGENRYGHCYDSLRKKAHEFFPGCREVAHWSAQDGITVDNIPYIGTFSPKTPNWYVAAGFQKWGMTTSMAASLILRDAVCGVENPDAEVFSPARTHAEQFAGIASEGKHAVKGLTKRILTIPDETASQLKPGEGGVITVGGEKLGAYKDEQLTIHLVDIRCPHLGCQLEWNPDEKSWDCPCHGSRFDFRGKLLSGPALKDIS